jgi:hypothetical protein
MRPLFDWATGKPTHTYDQAFGRADMIRETLIVLLLVALAFAFGASIVVIPTMPALGWCLFFGSVMGLAAFSATFGAAA